MLASISIAPLIDSGSYQQALEMFENGLTGAKTVLYCTCSTVLIKQDRAHMDTCRAGVARMQARLGDVRRCVIVDCCLFRCLFLLFSVSCVRSIDPRPNPSAL